MQALNGTRTRHTTFGSPEWKSALKLLSERHDLYELLLKVYLVDYLETDFFQPYSTFACWYKNNEELLARRTAEFELENGANLRPLKKALDKINDH